MSGLLSCPWCGADQNIEHEYADYVFSPNMAKMSRHCWHCGAEAPGVWLDEYDTKAEAEEAADAAWNTRAERTCEVEGAYTYGEHDELKSWALSCGHEIEWNDSEPPNYCPNCGARVVEL